MITVPELEASGVTQAHTLDKVPASVVDLVATMTGVDPARVKVKVEADAEPSPAIGKTGLVAPVPRGPLLPWAAV